MSADIIRLVVGGITDGVTGGAVDGNTGWVVGVVRHRRHQGHALIGEGVTVDVGQVVVDLAVRPGELELSRVGISAGGELDGDSVALLAKLLRVAALHLLHLGVLALADRGVVDGETAVVDDGGLAQGHGGGGEGKQHGCAGELGQRHVVVGWN